MRYYHLPRFSGIDALRLDERDVPVPGPREVLVRMRAWSLNHRDLLIARDAYGRGMKPDLVPLSDGAGDVVETGPEATRWKVGDRVTGVFLPGWLGGPVTAARLARALGGTVDGVLAEYVAFDEEALVATPAHLDDAEAATLPCAAVTAWQCLVVQGGLGPGQRVLTLGSGGVSVFALQFASLAGAEVVATSGSDAKLERLLALGAAHGVNHARVRDWGRYVHDLTDGGVDHVIDVGGGGTLPQSIRAARTGGRVSVVGVLSPGQGIDPVPLLRKALIVQGLHVGSREAFEAMNRAIGLHRLRPLVDRSFPFSDAVAAYRHLESGLHLGKVVIVAD
ncbi:zinc-dependent alcohol dehydrogenase family protein [Microbispora sp. ATCC PTA-5024]|uniref:zinc-dependent alcohol dehydrogenase family protein n=1 Tax=Microbispora sp. ATCC PTA-5024 TaxID=316330 RepID=UPI0003DC4DB3|nr:NAD(P)-dependent alcohol dehydrogenase [Microbispora sp. ATCC PTA-5024]ETK37159.1 NADPH:quinone oxidoreductase [Microbispora sp. ATCC PTA-5024]